MIKKCPEIFGMTTDNINNKFLNLKKIGYSSKDIIKITKKTPSIYSLNINNLNKKNRRSPKTWFYKRRSNFNDNRFSEYIYFKHLYNKK